MRPKGRSRKRTAVVTEFSTWLQAFRARHQLKILEIASVLDVRHQTIYRWLSDGDMPTDVGAVKKRLHIRWPEERGS